MHPINGYTIIENITETPVSNVFRALKKGDKNTVILKILKDRFPSSSDIARLKHEYDIIQKIRSDHIIQTHDMFHHGNGFVLVLEDIHGISINRFLSLHSVFTINAFLATGIKLCAALGDLHKQNIIHKDIKPSNILINPNDQRVKITDFGIAAFLNESTEQAVRSIGVNGTVMYISPEQTGRMNLNIDHRSDLYSLGATFYKMLTGYPPFQFDTPFELVHSHLARKPEPPTLIRADIPEILSDIVLKLLSKHPEDRYQSAFGVMADLEKCQKELSRNNKISAFKLGRKDVSGKFSIPHTLVGREKELNTLMDTFNRINQNTPHGDSSTRNKPAAVEIALVSGEPGIGKSSLVNELQKPLILTNGYFLSGKYEQLRGDSPYSAIIIGLKGLIRRILVEDDNKISEIKEKLLSAVGSNGQIIIDIIPELEKIIGPQPDIKELDPGEAKNRFNNLFERVISVLTQLFQPMVFFLDDLQWADMGSLQLIQKILTSASSNLLFVGSYRSNDIHAAHPLFQLIQEIQNNKIPLTHINLGPLNESQITALVVKFLKCAKLSGIQLAQIIHEKTGGNPFFIRIFLHTLNQKNLLKLDDKGKWSWDIEEISQTTITDNVVELLSKKITQLSEKEQHVLRTGACIGTRFDLDFLSVVSEMDLDDLLASLDEVIEQGFIGFRQNQYKFSHDRVREAVYAMIPISQKAQLHHKIGQTLLKQTKGNVPSEYLFFITDQFNLAIDVINDVEERNKLIQMNIDAAEKAQKSAAFLPALNYFKTAIRLLDASCWENSYELCIQLYAQASQAAYLASDYNQMDTFAQSVITSANNILDVISVYGTLIRAHYAQANFNHAVRTALDVLKQLEFPIPENPGKLKIGVELMKIKSALSSRNIDDLFDLPDVDDDRILAIFEILSHLNQVSFITSQELFAYATLKTARLSLKYGNCRHNAPGYMALAILFISILQNIETGYKLGNLSLKLIEKYNAKSHQARTLTLYTMMVAHWKIMPKDLIPEYTKAFYLCLENGDMEFSALNLLLRDGLSLLIGGKMPDLEKQVAETCASIHAINQLPTLNLNYIIWRNVLGYLDKDEADSHMPSDAPSNDEIIAQWESENAGTYLGIHYVYSLQQQYYFGNYSAALAHFKSAGKHIQSLASSIPIKDYYFFGTLTLLALYPQASSGEKRATQRQVKKCMKQLKKWAKFSPKTVEHRIKLIEAEWARANGQDSIAQTSYDSAIALAINNGFTVESAFAAKRAGEYYTEMGRHKIADIYLTEAYDRTLEWGSVSILKMFEEAYPDLIRKGRISSVSGENTSVSSTLTTTDRPNQALDLSTVLKASQAISGERELGKLLEKMMEITIENAGAQKGFMILEKQKQFFIEAEKTIGDNDISVLKSQSVNTHEGLCVSIVNYVARTHKTLILNDASGEGDFTSDPYVLKNNPKSVLCAPILNQGRLIGILYLENNLSAGVFTTDRMEVVNILSSQMAISIENAKFYQELEEKVRERTLQLKNANDKLKNLSFIDPLTNLHNRRYLYEFVSEVSDSFLKTLLRKLHRKERRNQNPEDKIFGVYLLDIDHFKSVNDTYGHQAGDAVLVSISNLLKSMIRSDDILVRWGGEEFLIVLQNITRDYLDAFPQRLINAIGETRLSLPNGQTITKTCSIGYTQMPFHFCQPDLLTLEQTINLSDYALYMAKENGRNQSVRIEITQGAQMDESFKHYLYNLSKNSELKQAYIRLNGIALKKQ